MTPIEQIKERLDIADVVGEYVQLARAGQNLKARCPFHAERTPSFFVSPERGTYYCFGCGAKGDVLSFVQQFEGLDFRGALEMLARRANVELGSYDPDARDKKERLYELVESTTQFYEQSLATADAANQYLSEERGLKPQTVSDWRVGYAPAAWRDLHDYLLARGYTADEMQEAGVLKTREGRAYDTFRGRIMFPIADTAGRVVAFSGRLFEPHGGDEPPKYVNSPETELYAKSKILFGFHKAKQGIRRLTCTIVVEGQVDVLMAHQVGYTNTVALSGTALTNEQVQQLSRLSQNLILALDADAAGATALQRSARRALALGMDVKVAALPSDADPADVIKADPEQWRARVRDARHAVEAVVTSLLQQHSDQRTLRREVSRQALPLVAAIKSGVDRAHFIRYVANAIDVPETAITEELEQLPAQQEEAPAPADTGAREMPSPDRPRREQLERQALGLCLWQETKTKPDVDVATLRERLAHIMGADTLTERQTAFETERDALLFEAETTAAYAADVQRYVDEITDALAEEYVKHRYDEAVRELRAAEAAGATDRQAALLQQCQDLSKQLAEMHARKRDA